MTKQEDKMFAAEILGIASTVRKCVLHGNEKIDEVIKASPYDEYKLESLVVFANLIMKGDTKESVLDRWQIAPELEKKFGKMGLKW